jgi:HPt (histidine-containing phosphotransfer) domain-containing protein
MLTANAGDESRQFYLSCGADDFLVKPIDEAQLHQSLSRVIEKRLAEGATLLPFLRDDHDALAEIFGIAPAPAGAAPGIRLATSATSEIMQTVNLKDRLKSALREDLPTRISTLDTAYAKQDPRALAELFHSLKGSAGFIWPKSDLVKLSAELEKLADRNDWDAVSMDISRLRAMLVEVAKGADA